MSTLWECPRCGAKLVSRNLSHACGAHSVEQFLEGKSDVGRGLFRSFVELLGACGPFDVAPARTRVAFMADVRFASVNQVGKEFIDVHFVLPRRVRSARFRRVDHLGKLYVHHVRLREQGDFDQELRDWLCASYVEYGKRGWLKRPGS